MNDRLLFIDTETGGLNPDKYSLLTIGLVVWDKNDGIIYEKEICQKLDDYVISQEALLVNNFNKFDYPEENTLTVEEINKEMILIKNKFFKDYEFIPIAGHNIAFDCSFIRTMYMSANLDFDSIFSHRIVDTYSILQYLMHLELIPKTINNSSSAFEFFKIKVKGRHTALGDSIATAQLYVKLLELIKK